MSFHHSRGFSETITLFASATSNATAVLSRSKSGNATSTFALIPTASAPPTLPAPGQRARKRGSALHLSFLAGLGHGHGSSSRESDSSSELDQNLRRSSPSTVPSPIVHHRSILNVRHLLSPIPSIITLFLSTDTKYVFFFYFLLLREL